MEVVGKSNAHIVLDSCLHESSIYFADHEKLIKCNPYCTNVKYFMELDIFQWVFQVADPRTNVFFIKKMIGLPFILILIFILILTSLFP